MPSIQIGYFWKRPKFYYSGHVRRLGHYFRNLYQAVKYVEAQTFLSPDEKYEYVQHLRAQMSVYEQSVFFFNSLSELGESWEWDKYYRKVTSLKDKKEIIPTLLITKYDLIRNTLNNNGTVADNISISDFYELVILEREEKCAVFGQLPFVDNNMQICRFCLNERYFGNVNYNRKDKIEALYQYDKTRFEAFQCSEPGCKSEEVLKKIKVKEKKEMK